MSLFRALQPDNDPPEFATIWPEPRPLPDFSLLDQDGNPVGADFFRGQWSLVFFGFTFCPDICPATLQQLALAQKSLDSAGEYVPGIVLVSVDPERDTPDAVKRYVGNFGENARALTGDIAELELLTQAAGVYFANSPLENGSYTVDHSTVVLLVNPKSAIHASFSAPHRVEDFVADLPRILGSP